MAVQQQEDYRCNWMECGLQCAHSASVLLQPVLLAHRWDWDQQELYSLIDGWFVNLFGM